MIPQSLSRTEHPRNLTSRFRRFVLKSQLKHVERGLSHKEYIARPRAIPLILVSGIFPGKPKNN